MDWISTWYPAAVESIGDARGYGASGSDGAPMPLITGIDTIGVLGMFSPSIVDAVEKFQGSQSGDRLSNRVVKSDANGLGNDGYFDNGSEAAIAAVGGISVAQWVAGHATVPGGYRRSPSVGGQSYEPWAIHATIVSDETDILWAIRQLGDDWQRLVDAAVAGIQSCGSSVTDNISTGSLSAFWSSVRRLCSSLDVLAENPPQSTSAKIKGATQEALHASEQFAGEAAAALADEAGKAAGNVARGFFGQAGVLALVVAGIAVFLYVH